MINIIINKWYNNHVSIDTVNEFENSILNSSSIVSVILKNNFKFIFKISSRLYRILKKFKLLKLFISKDKYNTTTYFIILMGYNPNLSLPYFFFEGSKNLFIFDAWPSTHDKIIDFANDFQICNIFVSSLQSSEMLKRYDSNCNFHWIPEGIDIKQYKFYDYKLKDIDVLQFGRKYDVYHNKIVNFLKDKGKIYLYEKQKGEIIFPEREDFISGLARTKISICFPSSITHPQRAEGIETMTIRYLQSMASKCLIIGIAPKEMMTIFGYNPIIDVDLNDPVNQLQTIMDSYENYWPLIEKNYINLSNHTWQKRWEQIYKIIS